MKNFLPEVLLFSLFLFSTPISAKNIFINEVMPNSSDGMYEWVEIYNASESAVSLIGWKLIDAASSEKSLDDLASIEAQGFIVYKYYGHGWLNNSSGDTINLKNNLGEILDNYSYSSDPGENKSFGRYPDGADNWIVYEITSEGKANPSPPETPTPTYTPTPLPTETPIVAATPTPTIAVQNSPSATPKPLPTKKITVTPGKSPTPTKKNQGKESSLSGNLSLDKSGNLTASPGQVKGAKTSSFVKDIPKILIIFGILMIVSTLLVTFILPKFEGKS